MSETKNHCLALDNYLDKYQPVRVQSMIGDTLKACLTGDERRSHELYENDKISLLYRIVLEDTGEQSNIQRLIIQLNEQAKYAIDEEERKKRRKAQALGGGADGEAGADDGTAGGDGGHALGQREDSIQDGSSPYLGAASEDPRGQDPTRSSKPMSSLGPASPIRVSNQHANPQKGTTGDGSQAAILDDN